jgi:RHS repeat-associated protein
MLTVLAATVIIQCLWCGHGAAVVGWVTTPTLADPNKDAAPSWVSNSAIMNQLSPLLADVTKDSDNDGFTDLQEYLAGSSKTDPNRTPEAFNLALSLAGGWDPNQKSDTDQYCDLQEFLAGSDPNDANSVPEGQAPALPAFIEYLSPSLEAQFDKELAALAKSLDYDPARIYNYVYENIRHEDYLYSRKGALATYMTQRGNEWDQCALLAALLRMSGVPARYVADPNDLFIYRIDTGSNGHAKQFVCVQAWANPVCQMSKCPGQGDLGRSWVPLVPWLKRYDVKQGIDVGSVVLQRVDDADPNGKVMFDGNWQVDANGNGAWGDSSHYISNCPFLLYYAEYKPRLTIPGKYLVYASVPNKSDGDPNVKVTIQGQSSSTAHMNQRSCAQGYQRIGLYDFKADGNDYVRIWNSTQSGDRSYADSVVFMRSFQDDYLTVPAASYYPMDAAATDPNRKISDESRLKKTGTASEALSTTSGKVGKALAFSDSCVDVDLPTSTPFGSEAGSVSMWFKSSVITEDYLFYGKDANYNLYVKLYSNKVYVHVSGSTSLDANCSVSDGYTAWRHLVLTWEKQDSGKVRLYLDGSMIGEWSHPGLAFKFSTLLRLGGRYDTSCKFTGDMDDVRIYNRALSAAEVRETYCGAPFKDEFDQRTQQTAVEYVEKQLQDYLNQNMPGKTLKDIVLQKEVEHSPSSVLPMTVPQELWFTADPTSFPVYHEVPVEDRFGLSLRVDKTGMIGYYPFDVASQSGNNWLLADGAFTDDPNGAKYVSNGTTPLVTGQSGFGNAVAFTTGSQHVELSGTNTQGYLHDGFVSRSVSMWIWVNSNSPKQMVYDEGDWGSGTGGLAIRVNAGYVEAQAVNYTTQLATAPKKAISAGAWHHLAVVFRQDPNHPDANCRLAVWLDGDANEQGGGLSGWVPPHGGPTWVGDNTGSNAFEANNTSGGFVGKIDDLRIYSRELQPEEIRDLAVNKSPDKDTVFQKTLYLPQLAGRRLTLDFADETLTVEPNTYSVKRGDLRLDGVVFSKGPKFVLQPGKQTISMGYRRSNDSNGAAWTVRPSIRCNAFAMFSYDRLAAYPAYVIKTADQLSKLSTADVLDPDSTPEMREPYLGRYASILSTTFDIRLVGEAQRFNDLMHGEVTYGLDGGCMKMLWAYPKDPNEFNENTKDKESAFLIHPSWRLDASATSGQVYKTIAAPEAAINFPTVRYEYLGPEPIAYFLSYPGQGASLDEGRIFEDWQGTPSLNTIAGIFSAVKDGIGVKVYRDPNMDPNIIRSDLNYADTTFEDAVVNEVAAGKVVTVPTQEVGVSQPDTGETIFQTAVRMVEGSDSISWLYANFNGSQSSYQLELDQSYLTAQNLYLPTSTYAQSASYGGYSNTLDVSGISNAAQSWVGDPVNMVNGEFYHEELPDISIRSRGLPLDCRRTYKSRVIYNGPFGFGWAWSHGEQIVPDANNPNDPNYVTYYDTDRSPLYCRKDGNQYTGPAGSTFVITRDANDSTGMARWIVTEKDGFRRTFNVNGVLKQKIDTNGNKLFFETDPNYQDRVTAIRDSLNRTITFRYNDNGKVVEAKDFTGRTCQYGYEGDDLIWAKDLEGNTTRYEYLKGQENPLNDHNMSRCILPTGDYLQIFYYKNDTVSHHTNSKGETFQFQYSWLNHYGETWNENGYYRKVFYNPKWDVTRVETEDKTVETSEYDSNHNRVKRSDGNGNIALFKYDGKRNLISKQDPNGGTWFYDYDPNYNKPTYVVDPAGVETTYQYDPNNHGNLIRQIEANRRVLAQRDPNNPYGYWFSQTTGDPNIYADPNNAVDPNTEKIETAYAYDANGNVTQATRANGDPNLAAVTAFRYDVLGLNRVEVVDPNGGKTRNSYDDLGRVIAVTDPAGNVTQYEYNQYDQQTRIIDPVGGVTKVEYTPLRQVLRKTDARGGVTEYVYDVARDLVAGAKPLKVIDPLGYYESYTYDAVGNMVSKTDRNGNKTEYRYDGLNRLARTIDPWNKSVRLSYDGCGNVVESTNRYGGVATSEYDKTGRPTQKTDPMGRTTVMEYDIAGRLTREKRGLAYDANGQPSTFTETFCQYDNRNRLTARIDGNQLSMNDRRKTGYTYDVLGRKTEEITYQSAGGSFSNYGKVQYDYDKLNNKVKDTVYSWDGGNWVSQREVSYVYDARNLLTSTTDGMGIQHRYAYDAAGRKISESVTVGTKDHTKLTDYDAVGNVVRERKMISNAGVKPQDSDCLAETRLAYDLRGQVVSVTDPNGGIQAVQYDKNGNKIAVIDEEGRIARTYYDALNRKLAVVDPLGNTANWEYDLESTDPNVAYVEAVTSALGARTVSQCNQNGELIKVTDALGNTVANTYDGRGRKTAVTETGIDGNSRTTRMTYTDFDELKTVEKWVNGQVSDTARTIALKTENTYDDMGRVVKVADLRQYVVDPNATDPNYIEVFRGETETTYDVFGNVTRVSQAKDSSANTALAVTDIGYDKNGRKLAEVRYLDGNTVSLSNLLDANTLASLGDPNTTCSALSGYATGVVATRFAYDSLGRQVSRTEGWELDSNAQTHSTTYDDPNRRTTTTDHWNASTTTNFDVLGRKVSQTDPNGDTTSWTYDRVGNVLSEDLPGSDWTTYYQYDELNRKTQVKRGSSEAGAEVLSTQTYDAEGRVSEQSEYKDGSNVVKTSFTYDAVGRVTLKNEDAGAGKIEAKTKYFYDGFGNLARIVDARFNAGADPNNDPNIAARYEYDALDRQTVDKDASNASILTVHEVFDSTFAGKRYEKVTQRDGVVVKRAYDVLGRLVEVDANGAVEQTFKYDTLSRMTKAVDRNGDIATRGRGVELAYDKFTRTVSETQGVVDVNEVLQSPRAVTRSYSDANGADYCRKATIAYPSSLAVTEYFEKRGLLRKVDNGGATYITYGYDAVGRTLSGTFGNTMKLASTYDSRGRESTRQYANSNGSVNLLTANTTGYDRRSNVTREQITYGSRGTLTRDYQYDNLGRLSLRVQSGDPNLWWGYDKVGNWTTCKSAPSDPNETRSVNVDNEYTSLSIDPNAPVYSARGEITQQRGWQYIYDWNGRLKEVKQQSGGSWTSVATYTYDGMNRRVTKTVGGSACVYVYDGSHVIEEYCGGNYSRRYIYGSGLDEVVASENAGAGDQYYYMLDGLGSVRALASYSAATVVEFYDYSPFGKQYVYDSSWTSLTATAHGNAVGYTGHWLDAESGLWEYRNRYYDPVLGRFLTRDPAGYRDGMNLYAYVRNNPLRYTDPDGLMARSAVNWVSNAATSTYSYASNVVSGFRPSTPAPSSNWFDFSGAGTASSKGTTSGPFGGDVGGVWHQAESQYVSSLALQQGIESRQGFASSVVAEANRVSAIASGHMNGPQAQDPTAQVPDPAFYAPRLESQFADAKAAIYAQARAPVASLSKAYPAYSDSVAKGFDQGWQYEKHSNTYLRPGNAGGIHSTCDEVFFGPALAAAAKSAIWGAGRMLAAGEMDTIAVGQRMTTYYPPNRGFLGTPTSEVLQNGTLIDRFGYNGGSFVAPYGTPMPMRALPPGAAAKPYSVLEVTNPLQVQSGRTAPWFGQSGLGRQYELPMSVQDAINGGYIKKVGP